MNDADGRSNERSGVANDISGKKCEEDLPVPFVNGVNS